MTGLFELIKMLTKSKFHGTLTIKFFNGEIRHVEETKSHDVKMFQ